MIVQCGAHTKRIKRHNQIGIIAMMLFLREQVDEVMEAKIFISCC